MAASPKDASPMLKKVLLDITPSEKERSLETQVYGEIISILKKVIQNINPKVEPMIVGSMAKGTDLAGDKDFDIFIRFPESTSRDDLENQGLAIGKAFFSQAKIKWELSYAEHPYVKGRYLGSSVEIVPCYKLSGKLSSEKPIISSVDRTPLHTEFVLSELKKDPRRAGDIRLLKKFMKAQGLYGAHAAVEGFSGYLCELLVIKYGSFMGVIKAASEWKKDEYLTLAKKQGKSFPEAPLVFIDPVDEGRNVAAAMSVAKLAKFIYAAELFLSKPDKKFFYAKGREKMNEKEFKDKLKERGTKLICIRFKPPQLVEDTLVPQLAKSLKAISHECSHAGFRVLKKGYWTDKSEAALLLELEVWQLPNVMKKPGPFFDSKVADMEGFVEGNKKRAMSGLYLEEEMWAIDVPREFTTAEALIKSYLKDPKAFGKDLREVRKFGVLASNELIKIKSPLFWVYMGGFW
jgi:tRNA nucleotidyltransferase (CCA-adding enzyme)